MYSSVTTAILRGMDAVLVQVEADVSAGLPVFEMVGFLASEVKEAKERVRTALKNCGYQLPAKRITISFSPAGIRKSGSGFDLAVAIAILAALGVVSVRETEKKIFLGELNLSGKIVPVSGVLSMLAEAAEQGYETGVVSQKSLSEAALISGMDVAGFYHLKQVVSYLNKKETMYMTAPQFPDEKGEKYFEGEQLDFAEIHGQKLLKRACEIAVAGRHHLLMIGSSGAGKTMAAKRIPSILPPMTEGEKLEVAKIYSICGIFDKTQKWSERRPYRSPHHTISPSGLAGGGGNPMPGEISLAHNGVLFLDELTEFKASTLEILRQPLEEKRVQIVRAHGNYTFPADFILIAAMNPCACGHYPDMQKCRCSESDIQKYKNKISQPLLDRIDLCIKVEKIPYEKLYETGQEESSAKIRERVIQAHERQKRRYEKEEFFYNSQIPAKKIGKFCNLDTEQKELMNCSYENFDLSILSYHKILKTARTIADLEDCAEIKTEHLHEALCYRAIDRNFWESER
ncbi:MAG: YifB family Mg chelatase-like AAA ATPase [Lachnospiraceae bacterium]|nr:YifB family Mg chelatase-like AAA ATPase [Lachnospiraceae bacterium]